MNSDIVEGNWEQFKDRVKIQWDEPTDDRLDALAGKRERLSGTLQERHDLTKDRARRQIKRFGDLDKG